MAKVKLTGFGDEIDASLEKQLSFMEALGIHAIETRGIDGVNISALTDWQARAARARLDAHGFEVSALGSPIGKSDIKEDFAISLDAFTHTGYRPHNARAGDKAVFVLCAGAHVG